MSDKPAFEVRYLDGKREVDKTYAVYENGKIEGFPPEALILNRIPCLINLWKGRLYISQDILAKIKGNDEIVSLLDPDEIAAIDKALSCHLN